MNNYYFTMATQHSQMIDRKRTRTDILTTSLDSAPICSWPRFLLIKGTDNERPLSKLSPFAVNKAIVAVLGSDPFNIRKLRNGDILVEVDKDKGQSWGFYVPFNSQGHIGTGPQNCHLWDSNPQR